MKPYKIAAYRRRFYYRWPLIRRIILIVAIILALLLFLRVKTAPDRSDHQINKIKSMTVASVTQTPPRTLSDKEMILALPHGDLVWKTYGHESTWGKFDGCRAQGKYNGFGFEQDEHGYRCFDSLEEVATSVSAWFDHYVQVMTVRQTLCFYRYGKLMNDCDYADYSLNLLKENDGKEVNKSG